MHNRLIPMAITAALLNASPVWGQVPAPMINHNSVAAVSLVLAHRQDLQLTQSQVVTLSALRAALDREETRLVPVGRFGGMSKGAAMEYRRVLKNPLSDVYTRVTVRTKVGDFNRVPGKSVARVERTSRMILVQRPCPFAFLASAQRDQIHTYLSGM